MNQNEQLIKKFYDCFGKKDWNGMLECYHEEIFFYDPVFQNLEGAEVRAMWEMLLRNAKDLQVTAGDISAVDDHGACHWVATYTFSATGRQVVNKCKASFTFREGKIIEHQDEFSFWNWSRQALGLPGLLLGGTSLLQKKVRRQARQSLDKFMADHPALNSDLSQL
jgi:ketosteroid isomerase-like protein